MSPKDHTDFNDIRDPQTGAFQRPASHFRNTISSSPGSRFPPAKNRYVLYLNRGCPWAHRTNIVRTLKGLEPIIQLVTMSFSSGAEGWVYDGKFGSDPCDPLYGFTKHKELYMKADPGYEGRYTVPVLWDKVEETIVSNESSEIIRMFYHEFDGLLEDEGDRNIDLLPEGLRERIEEMNGWVYDLVNNGVYKVGFATGQVAYEESLARLFEGLDRVEGMLRESGGPFVFGEELTEADVRLYVTIVRFDPAYHTLFRCNLKMIRHDYPHIQKWLMHVYYDNAKTKGAFRETTYFDAIKHGYAFASKSPVVPVGPLPHMMPQTGK